MSKGLSEKWKEKHQLLRKALNKLAAYKEGWEFPAEETEKSGAEEEDSDEEEGGEKEEDEDDEEETMNLIYSHPDNLEAGGLEAMPTRVIDTGTARPKGQAKTKAAATKACSIGGVTQVDVKGHGRRYLHEWTQVKIENLPQTNLDLKSWKMQLKGHLRAAAGRNDTNVIAWVTEAEYSFSTMETLRNSGDDWVT